MISIIVAVADNGVIGCQNKLIWHISEDLKRFKSITTGHPVIMGRKTYESIGRPLPGRTNIVISRQKGLRIEGVTVVGSTLEAISLFMPDEDIFIIGGGQIFEQTLPFAERVYYTQVHQSPQGDAHFEPLSPKEWCETLREEHDGYTFINYDRCRR